MPTYQVWASETVYYMIEVKAESPEEARKMVQDGECELGLPYDSENFIVDNDVEEI